MTSVAAEVADGLIVHGFTTERYLREVTWPLIDTGLKRSGRRRDQFTVSYPGLLATGETEAEFEAAIAAVRGQIAFYASTPAYRAVLDLHGWGGLHDELHRLSVRGDWAVMSALIDDEVLCTFAVVASPDEAGQQIQRRYGDLIDRYTIYTPYPLGGQTRRRVVAGLHAASRTAVADA
jgi:probable F420-dependent oxidoreductase